MPLFEPGEIVRLKSGGPAMTVCNIRIINEDERTASFKVAWFSGDEMHTREIPGHALKGLSVP